MSFTSYLFIGFLLILLTAFYLLPKRCQWPLLLVGSYVFYYFAGKYCLLYIIATTIAAYFIGRWMQWNRDREQAYLHENKGVIDKETKKTYKAKMKSRRRAMLTLGLLFCLGILAVVKYTNFTISNINVLLKAFSSEAHLSFLSIAMPLGLSFYTFQTVSYLIDVYRDKHPCEKNIAKLALFVSFFPQLIQGPISRYSDLGESLFSRKAFSLSTVERGLERVLWGYFKKLVIADRMLIAVKTLIGAPQTYTGVYVFLGMLFYALELYADFTGGIDITIGVAEMFGVKVKENFIRPYFSKSIKEYWRRWHITMGTWFTDYIFYPISVSGPFLKLSKWSRNHLGEKIGKRVPVYLATLVVWFATGIWHGASWNFIVWGLLNAVVIMISQELEPLYRKFHTRFPVDEKVPYKVFAVIRTVLLMSSLRMLDCYRDVPLTFKMFGTMFTTGNWGALTDGSLLKLGITLSDYIILGVGTLILFLVSMYGRKGSVRDRIRTKAPAALRYAVFFMLFVIILVFGAYGHGFDMSQFIYNQF
ncbi:MAG TPA: MBOAT family O-acyltransferase [Bacillota bacterium]|nr:MBOAT family O-acyltransferase [Bacillota bacterium]HPE38337.1 MBOAT family O-acyltransferase [Bacillota bacterium]